MIINRTSLRTSNSLLQQSHHVDWCKQSLLKRSDGMFDQAMCNKAKRTAFENYEVNNGVKLNLDYVQNYCKLRKTEIELHKSGMKGYKIVICARKNYLLLCPR